MTFLHIYCSLVVWSESILSWYSHSEKSSDSWNSYSNAPAKFHMGTPVQFGFKMKRRAKTGRLIRYRTSSDCVPGDNGIGTHSRPRFPFQFSAQWSWCMWRIARRPLSPPAAPSPHHLLAWNPCDLVSPRALTPHLLSQRAERSAAVRDGLKPQDITHICLQHTSIWSEPCISTPF